MFYSRLTFKLKLENYNVWTLILLRTTKTTTTRITLTKEINSLNTNNMEMKMASPKSKMTLSKNKK